MILTRLSLALASGGRSRFDVAYDLFRAGEQGFWYDMNDPNTLFQDSAGTTPATWGDPVGRQLDKSGNGNHRIQATSGARPILGRMPKRGRVNLLVSTEDVSNAAFGKTSITTPNANTIVEAAASSDHVLFQSVASVVSGQAYTKTVSLGKGSLATAPDVMQISMAAARFGATQFATVNVLTGAVVNTAGGATCTALGADPANAGAFLFSYTATATSSGAGALLVVLFCNNDPLATRSPSYLGAITSDCRVYKVQAEDGSTFTGYQHVIDSLGYNVTESGQPSCGYLSFNGSNQWMQTASSVDFSATNKLSVFTGLRANTAPALGVSGIVIEQSVSSAANNGFNLQAPASFGAGNEYDYGSLVRTGGDRAGQGFDGVTQPTFDIFTAIFNASEATNVAQIVNRIDGNINAAFQFDGTFGPGNFPSDAVYFGARAGTSLFFNGLVFSSIARGALTSGTLLARTEQYVARQTPTVTL